MKKRILLVSALSVTTALFGCSTNSTQSTAKGPATLTIMAVQNAQVIDYNTNAFTQWLEKKANVNINWQLVSPSEAQAKLSATLAGGNYPDIIMGFNISPAQQVAYGDQGVFLPLNSYIDKYGDNTKAAFQKMPTIKQYITSPNGNIYALPRYSGADHVQFPEKLWIYNPWMKKLNLTMPTTTQQFQQVLESFKNNDPNGNGQKVTPLAGTIANGAWEGDPLLHLMSAFIYTDPTDDYLFLNNNTVVPAAIQPQWKQGLQYMHDLYANGLLSPETYTQNADQYKKMANQQPNMLGAAAGGAQSVYTQITTSTSDNWNNWVSVPPLTGPSGTSYPMYQPLSTFSEGMFSITNACKDPVSAFKLGDLFFNQEVIMRKTFGVPGTDWSENATGEGINGKKATFTILQAYGNRQNNFWGAGGAPEYMPEEVWGGKAADQDPFELQLDLATQQQYSQYVSQPVKSLPPLWFDSNQSAQVAQMNATITPYIQSMIAKFITGQANISTDWDTYVNTLNKMGLTTMTQIYQSAYDKSYAKK